MIFSITACATKYKPKNYDVASKVFNNYDENYSIKIPEGYCFSSFLSDYNYPKEIDKVSKKIIKDMPTEMVLVTDKNSPIYFLIQTKKMPEISNKRIALDVISHEESRNDFKQAISAQFKDIGIGEIDKVSQCDNYLLFEKKICSELIDVNLKMAVTFYEANEGKNDVSCLIIECIYFPSSAEKTQRDFNNIFKMIKLNAFNEKNRLNQQ